MTKILKKNSNRRKCVEVWAKNMKTFGNFGRISPARHLQKSSQHVRVCAAGDGAICSKNRIIVPYHGDNPNTRNGACLRSPSPIIAPEYIQFFQLSCNIQTLFYWGRKGELYTSYHIRLIS